MLVIREEQMRTLEQIPIKAFKDDMLVYLQERFPEDFEVLGEAQTRRVIELGIDRAAAHGFETRGDICDYISVMFGLGSYFDEDPLLPWATEVLKNNEGVNPSTLLTKLYAKAADYSRRVHGEDAEYYAKALLRIRRIRFSDLMQSKSTDYIEDIKSRLRLLYLQRYEELTETGVERLMDQGGISAGRYGLVTREGILIYCLLVFMLGSHFDRDPLQPWAASILKDNSITDPDLRARRLYEAAMARLNQALDKDASTGM